MQKFYSELTDHEIQNIDISSIYIYICTFFVLEIYICCFFILPSKHMGDVCLFQQFNSGVYSVDETN